EDDPYLATGTIAVGSVDDLDEERNERAKADNERSMALDARERAAAEEDPFGPVGMRVGTFRLYPSLEQGLTWTSNADYSSTGRQAVLSETTLNLAGVSDWSRHAAEFSAYATLRKTLSGQEV